MKLKQLTIEALVVGLITLLASHFFNMKSKLQIFIMGVVIHIVFELSGANAYYCKHGAACL